MHPALQSVDLVIPVHNEERTLQPNVARRLLPHVADDGWFFDTELLLLAGWNRLRIHEVPVDWIEDLDSRVDLLATIAGDLGGLWRVRRGLWRVRREYWRRGGRVSVSVAVAR